MHLYELKKKILDIAGNYINEDGVYSLMNLISTTPKLQTYSVIKIHEKLKESTKMVDCFKIVGLWVLGEFGMILVNGSAINFDDKTSIKVWFFFLMLLFNKLFTIFSSE